MFLVRAVIAQQLLVATSPVYFETQQKVFDEQIPGVKKAMFDRIGEIVTSAQDKQKAINRITCMSLKVKTGGFPNTHWCDQSHWNSEVEYNEENNTCTKRWKHWKRNGCGIAFKWLRDEDKDKEKTVQMPTLDRSDLRGDNGSTSGIKDAINAAQTKADTAVDPLDKFSEDD